MVKGFQSFARWFQGYEKEYAIIGGTACDLLMSAEGLLLHRNLERGSGSILCRRDMSIGIKAPESHNSIVLPIQKAGNIRL